MITRLTGTCVTARGKDPRYQVTFHYTSEADRALIPKRLAFVSAADFWRLAGQYRLSRHKAGVQRLDAR